MKVLIDTNIILDVLCKRQEFYEDSAKVFKLCEVKKIAGVISALSIPNIVYIMRKELDAEKIREILDSLSLIFDPFHRLQYTKNSLRRNQHISDSTFRYFEKSFSAFLPF